MTEPNRRAALFRQYSAGIVSQLGVVAVGSAYVWLAPLTLRLEKGEEGIVITAEQMSSLISAIEVGPLICTILSGYLADWYGRKVVSLSIGPLCLVSWAIIIFTRSIEWLFVARLIQGLATGVVFTVNPIYTAEIVEPSVRGSLTGGFQIALYIGCLYSYCFGPYLTYNWYTISFVPLPFIYTVAFIFFPESPYWLLKKGKENEAKRSLSWFRAREDVNEEFNKMRRAVEDEMGLKTNNAWVTLFSDMSERKAFFIVQIVAIARYLTGLTTMITYCTEMFSKSLNFVSPSEMSIIFGILLTVMSFISAALSDKVGRKPLLVISCFGSFVSHFLAGIYYFLVEETEVHTSPHLWMLYVGISGYCFFANIGLAPLLQTLKAELFGAKTRELAGGITETFIAVLAYFIIRVYQPISDHFGVYCNFMFYAIVGLISGILLAIFMYETAGKQIGRRTDEQKTDNTKTLIPQTPI